MNNYILKSIQKIQILVLSIFVLFNCQLFDKDKVDDSLLNLGLLYVLSLPPEYTVVVTARLETAGSVPIKDGLVKIVDTGSFLSGGQGNIEDFTSCANDTVNAGTADSTVDGDFTLLFRTERLSGNLGLNLSKSIADSSATTCNNIANFVASSFTTSIGPDATVAINLNLNDRTNFNQFVITTGAGYTIFMKSISVTVRGEYNLVNPTVGENICDGKNATSPIIKEGTILGSETWSGAVILRGTVFADAPITVLPGTVVYGSRGSSLYLRGGNKLTAIGTASNPICWTSANSPGSRFPGDWGGIVVIGTSGATRTSNAEGTTPQGYGGAVGSDVLNLEMAFNIIEFAGNEVAPGDELNNISIYASRSSLTNVQLHRGLDDQIEAWGGSGVWSRMLATGGQDDDFDLDEGFTGTLTNIIGHKYPASCGGTVSTDPHGFEMDGTHNNGTGGCVPAGDNSVGRCTNPTISRVTLIGQKITSGEAMRLREKFAGSVSNAVAYNFLGSSNVVLRDSTSGPAPTTGALSNVLIEVGKTENLPGTADANLSELPIISEGSVPNECGFGAAKPDYTLKAAYNSYQGGANSVGKFWDGWAVFRAR